MSDSRQLVLSSPNNHSKYLYIHRLYSYGSASNINFCTIIGINDMVSEIECACRSGREGWCGSYTVLPRASHDYKVHSCRSRVVIINGKCSRVIDTP